MMRRPPARIGIFALCCVVVGVVCGLAWHAILNIPVYLAAEDGSVKITERAQSQIFSIDVMYVNMGILVGIAIGTLAWVLFRRLGWLVGPIAVAGSLASGGVCVLVGMIQGPSGFAEHVAAAVPGDQIPVDFQLHTPIAWVVWGLAATIPVVLYVTLARRPLVASDGGEAATESADELVGGELEGESTASTGDDHRVE